MQDEKLKALEEKETRAREEFEEFWRDDHWRLLASAKTDEPFTENMHPDFSQVKQLLDSKETAYKRAQVECLAYERLGWP